MKKFWKWFFIVLGALVLIAIGFGVTMFLLRGGAAHTYALRSGYGMMGSRLYRPGLMMGGMMFLMVLKGLFWIGLLVLAGFGVAYLVKGSSKKSVPAAPVMQTSVGEPQSAAEPTVPVCASCGKPVQADWSNCPYCGNPLTPPTPPQA
jgi:hypothetical protein